MCRCCPSACVLVVGSKCELVELVKVSAEDGAAQAARWGAAFLAISSRNATNVDAMCAIMLACIKKAQAT